MTMASYCAISLLFSVGVSYASENNAILSFWNQEAGDSRRNSAIEITGLGPTPYGYVLVEDLGAHKFDIAGVWPSLPVFGPTGDVIVADVDSFVLQLTNPEQVGEFDLDGWPDTVYTPSGAIILGGIPEPSSSVAVSTDNMAYVVNRHTSVLHAINLATNKPLWPPLNLTMATNGKGFLKYKAEFAFLLHGGKLWLPDPNQHGALVVSAATGQYTYTQNMDLVAHRFQGSVGSTDPLIKSELAAFTDAAASQPRGYGGLYGVTATEPFNTSEWAWQAAVPFTVPGSEFSHPVIVEFKEGTKTWGCVISTQSVAGNLTEGSDFLGGVRISGVSVRDGSVCGDGELATWGTNPLGGSPGTYVISNDFTKKITWASAPAVIVDGGEYRLYYNINTATPNRCVLMTVLVTYNGVYIGPTETRAFAGLCNSAPVALLNAYGKGKHAVAIILQAGGLHIVDWKVFSPSQVDWPLAPYLPAGTSGAVFAGNYISASPHGTLLVVVHEQSINHAYLVAVVGALNGKAPNPSATPSPSASASASATAYPTQAAPSASAQPAPNNAPASTTNVTPAGVAGGIFGTLGALGVIATFIVFRYPTSSAARVISTGASAALSASKTAVKSVSAAISSAASSSRSSSATLPTSNTPLFASTSAAASAERAGLLSAARK